MSHGWRRFLLLVVAGAISAIANFLQFSLIFGGDNDNPLGVVGTIAMAMLAPIAAGIIQMSISRQREYIADATGAELLGDPLPLADALGTLQRGAEAIPMKVNQSAAPLFIVNPLAANARAQARGGGGARRLFSTHPPMEERIERLRRMAGQPSMRLSSF